MPSYIDMSSGAVLRGLSHSFDFLFSDDLSRMHTKRLDYYRNNWLFYLGKHWSYERDTGEDQVTMNYCRKVVDKHLMFCFKKGFKTVIPDDPSTPENEKDDRDFVRIMLEETWRKNNKNLWLLEAGQQGGVTGDLFVRVSWEKNDPLEDPYARVDIIPSHMCFPEFGGLHGVDRKQIKRMLIVVPTFKETNINPLTGAYYQRGTKTASRVSVVMKGEEWLPAKYEDGIVVEESKVILYEDGIIVDERINPLGEIPVVHVPNYPLSGEYYGLSDLVDITDLNRELNEKTTDIGDIIDYHSAPVTVVYGAKLSDLEKGANKMWGMPSDARVENLELKSDLRASKEHLMSLKTSIMEMADIPEVAMGSMQKISNTPGVTFQLQYMPMLEKRDVKVLTYGMGLRLINRLILRITSIADPSFGEKFNLLKGNKYRNDVVFPDPMPQDVRRELEIDQAEQELGITTRSRMLEKRGYSQREIQDILEGVKKEKQEDAEMFLSTTETREGVGSGNATFNRGGFNETMGEKISNTVGNQNRE